MYAVTTSSGIPRVRPFYKPRNTAHTVMLFNWVLLALYGATFAFGDPVLLYYFKVGTRYEYAMVNHLAIGILSCIIGLAVAMSSFPPNLQAKYCLLHGAVIEPLCMGVMFWQENAYTLLRDGIVDRQWCNHLFIKMTLAMPWMYGYLACRRLTVKFEIEVEDSLRLARSSPSSWRNLCIPSALQAHFLSSHIYDRCCNIRKITY